MLYELYVDSFCFLQAGRMSDSAFGIFSFSTIIMLHGRYLFSLRELTAGRLSTISYKGCNFCDFLFAFLHIGPLLKRDLL